MLEGDNSLPIAKEKATTMEISWDVANNKVVQEKEVDTSGVNVWPDFNSGSEDDDDDREHAGEDNAVVDDDENADSDDEDGDDMARNKGDGTIDSNFETPSSSEDESCVGLAEKDEDEKINSDMSKLDKKARKQKNKRKRKKSKHHGDGHNSAEKDGFTQKHNRFVIKNGCCRECMKAFSKQGKACLC